MFNLRKAGITLSALIWLTVFLVPKLSTQAAGDPVIVLDNATPSADITITPTNSATGAVYAELDSAALKLLDSANNAVLTLSDPHVAAIGIQLAQSAAPHILHLERLPGIARAHAQVTAQKILPEVKAAESVATSSTLSGPMQIKAMIAPTHTIPVFASASANMLTVQFAPQDTTFQLIASDTGVVLSGTAGKQISGLSLRLSPGQYTFNLMNQDRAARTEVTVSLSSAPALTMTKVVPTATVPTVVTATNQPVQAAQLCTVTVNTASVALYSGPGTAYSTLGYATRGNVFAVGGINREGNWLLVQSQRGGAWIAGQAVMVSGDCNTLTIIDTPAQNASSQATATIRPRQQRSSGTETREHNEDHEEEHEGEEHDD